MARILLIHNAEAGDGGHSAEDLRRTVAIPGWETVFQSAWLDDFACVLSEPWELIVAAGGDGAVTRVLRACAGLEAPLAIIPLGTANNVARGLGHFGPADELVKRWDVNSWGSFHLGQARGGWGMSRFAETFGIGLLAQTIVTGEPEEHEQFRDRHEKLDTLSGRLQEMVERLAPERMEIHVDGRDFSGDYLWLEAGRVSTVGPNLAITQQPEPWSQRLYLALLTVDRRSEFLAGLRARDGGDRAAPLGLKMLSGSDMSIAWPTLRAHIDGVVLPRGAELDQTQKVRLAVHPAPVRVLTLR